MSRKNNPTDNANYIINFVKDALKTHGSDNVCVSVDEEEDKVIVAYHSSNNGYPITETGISPDDVNLKALSDGLDALDVAYDADLMPR